MAAPELGLKDRTLTLRYEALHTDLDRLVGGMFDFLGVDPALADAPSAKTKTLPGFTSADGGGDNPQSLYRKGAVGEWRNSFGPAQRGWFDAEAGGELIQLGYEPDRAWLSPD
jgi:hypothetical protein